MAESSRLVLLVRYSLLPYLYSLFHLAHTRGTPVIRPLAFEYVSADRVIYIIKIIHWSSWFASIIIFLHRFPLDHIARAIDEQFLWGPALLISPVLKNVCEKHYFARYINAIGHNPTISDTIPRVLWASYEKCSPRDCCRAIKYFVTVQTSNNIFINVYLYVVVAKLIC